MSVSRKRLYFLACLTIAVAALCVLSIAIGVRSVGWGDIYSALQGQVDTMNQAAVATRIPRTVLAALVGAALGLSGAIMQGITRNPLADPGILGVNAGAALAIVVSTALFGVGSAATQVWTAISGAGLTALFVYTIGSAGRGGATPLKLALAGTATGIALAGFTTAVVLPRNDIAGGIRSWQIGGVGGATFDTLFMVLPFLLAGLVISLLCARKLNTLALGDELAAGLGESVAAARGTAAFAAIVLCGAATAACGPIGFVGLVVPHFCRLLGGVDHRWLLPCATLAGAALLLLADVIGRIIARPSELDVGIVTAFIGAPFFIAIVRRQRVREL